MEKGTKEEEMAIINAKRFAEKTGYPLAMVRAFCREGKISHWQRGRVYLIEEKEALAEMQKLKSTIVYKPHRSKKSSVAPQIVRKANSAVRFDYRTAIQDMRAEIKKQ